MFDYERAIAEAMAKVAKRPLGGPIRVLPGLSNDNPVHWDMMHELRDRLATEFPLSQPEGAGLAFPAIGSDFTELYNLMGHHPTPSGTPPADRSKILAEHEGWTRLSERHAAIARALVDLLVTGERVPYNIPLKRDANSGLGPMVKDPETKLKLIHPWLVDPERLFKAIAEADMRALADEGIVFAYYNAYRVQADVLVDGRPKKRIVYDWNGEAVEQDKISPLTDRMYRCRTRTVSAGPLSAFYPLRLVARSCQAARSQYDETFKHYTTDDIARKISGGAWVRAFDVSNHDYFIPYEVLSYMEGKLAEKFRPEIGRLFRWSLTCPMLIGADYPKVHESRMRGDPLDPGTFTFDYGNTSGNPLTTEIAMIGGALYALCVVDNAGLLDDGGAGGLAGAVDRTLRGLGQVRILIAGDNIVFVAPRELEVKLPYCKLGPSATFLGSVFTGTRGDVIPSLPSLAIRFFCADASIDSPRRKYWAFGYLERQGYFGRHPLAPDMLAIIDEVVEKHIGETVTSLAERNYVAPAVEGLTDIAADFLANPDTVHYKYAASDIPRDVLDKVFLSIGDAPNRRLGDALHKEAT